MELDVANVCNDALNAKFSLNREYVKAPNSTTNIKNSDSGPNPTGIYDLKVIAVTNFRDTRFVEALRNLMNQMKSSQYPVDPQGYLKAMRANFPQFQEQNEVGSTVDYCYSLFRAVKTENIKNTGFSYFLHLSLRFCQIHEIRY